MHSIEVLGTQRISVAVEELFKVAGWRSTSETCDQTRFPELIASPHHHLPASETRLDSPPRLLDHRSIAMLPSLPLLEPRDVRPNLPSYPQFPS